MHLVPRALRDRLSGHVKVRQRFDVRRRRHRDELGDPLDQDQRAVDRAYNDMEPRDVLDWLQRSATTAADTAAGFTPDDWSRKAEYPYGQRELVDIVRNMVHEGVHHLRDLENVLRAVIGKPLPTDDEDD